MSRTRCRDDAALCVFRVVQEALANVVKHSGAADARVMLSGGDGGVVLRVEDGGRGFEPDTLPRRHRPGEHARTGAIGRWRYHGALHAESRHGDRSARAGSSFADSRPADRCLPRSPRARHLPCQFFHEPLAICRVPQFRRDGYSGLVGAPPCGTVLRGAPCEISRCLHRLH